MNKTEKEFWSSTLRKIYKQLDIYTDLNNKKDKNGKSKTEKSEKGIVKGETVRLKSIE